MNILNRIDSLARARAQTPVRPNAPWTCVFAAAVGALAAAAGCFAVAFAFCPVHLVMPVAATGLLLAAASLGLVACIAPPETGASRVVLWDCAGALSLIGLAAALLGEPEQAMALLERDR